MSLNYANILWCVSNRSPRLCRLRWSEIVISGGCFFKCIGENACKISQQVNARDLLSEEFGGLCENTVWINGFCTHITVVYFREGEFKMGSWKLKFLFSHLPKLCFKTRIKTSSIHEGTHAHSVALMGSRLVGYFILFYFIVLFIYLFVQVTCKLIIIIVLFIIIVILSVCLFLRNWLFLPACLLW